MTELPLPQRVRKNAGGGCDCLFTVIHMALKGWFGRKWSAPVLVELQTPGVGAGKPWVPARRVGLHAPGYRHMALGLLWALRPDPHAWLQTQANGSSGRLSLWSCIRTHCCWVLRRDPILLGIGFINIIICVINIIIFLMIQSIHLKNIIIFVL